MLAVERFSKWPTAKVCKTSEAKEGRQYLTNNFNLYGMKETIKLDNLKGKAFISKEYKNCNIGSEYCTPRIYTGNGTVERATQNFKNLMLAKKAMT